MRQTTMTKPAEVVRQWHIVDGEGQTLGRLATQVAHVLRGKHKPTFTPNVDTGDNIIVINAEKIKLTGRKATDKLYHHHSNHPGGLKTRTAGEIRENNPERLIEMSVKGMLPKNSLGHNQFLKLHVYAGGEHKHQAQNPEVLDITDII